MSSIIFSPSLTLTSPDHNLLESLLTAKHKESTRKTYLSNLATFAKFLTTGEIIKGDLTNLDGNLANILEAFVNLEKVQALNFFMSYKNCLIDLGYAPNSINLKLAAVRSLIAYANETGACIWSLALVKSLPEETYKDTKGVSPIEFQEILTTITNPRDYVIFRLLWDCGLRRSELASLSWEHVDLKNKTISVTAKGKVGRVLIPLAQQSIDALQSLSHREGAVLINKNGGKLSDKGIYRIVQKYSDSRLRPHKIRHSVVTALLVATNGNTKKVQDFSRHKSSAAIAKYDDNLQANQAELVSLAGGLV